MKSLMKQCRMFKEKVVCYFSDFDLDSNHAYALMELSLRLISKYSVCLKRQIVSLISLDRIQRF